MVIFTKKQLVFKLFYDKKIFPFLFFLLSFLIGVIFFSYSFKEKDSTILFFAVGDIMLDRGVALAIKEKGGEDYRYPFLKITNHLEKADILFGNLESVISDKKGEKIKKTGPVQVHFKANSDSINGLLYAGFDVLSVANNHILDYGSEVMEDCLSLLKESNIKYVGAGFDSKEVWSVKILELKNTKIGFLAYTYPRSDGYYISWRPKEKNNSGVAVIIEEQEEIEKIKEDIAKAREKVDILMVSLHYGREYSFEPTAAMVRLSQGFIDAGADLVLGHHPHVVHPVEKYKHGWIAYSLGNFVFDMRSERTRQSMILEVKIENKKIKEVRSTAVNISIDTFQPYLTNDVFN